MEMLFELALLLALAVVHTVLGVAVHEGGHLALGLATGYRFVSFNILSFVWVKEDGRLRLRRNKNSLMGGQCLLAPPEDEAQFRYGWYNAGGGLFNLLLAALLLPGFLLTRGGGLYLNAFCLMGVAMNLVLELMNLVPMTVGIPNDGMNLVMAARSPLARHALYLMLKVNDEVQRGKRYRDYPPGAFPPGRPVSSGNYLEVYLLMLEAARLDDLGEQEAAIGLYAGVDLGRLNRYYADSIRIDRLYYYCVYSTERDRAREIYGDRRLQRLLKNPVPPCMRVRAAVQYFLLDEREAALGTMEQARAALERQPSQGLRTMENDWLDELAEAMEAEEQNSLDGLDELEALDGPDALEAPDAPDDDEGMDTLEGFDTPGDDEGSDDAEETADGAEADTKELEELEL